jgi:DNA-binding beta-propeller fold protein YncE
MLKSRLLGLICGVCVLSCSLVLLSAAGALAADSGYKVVRTIPVGGDGFWDYLRVDPDAHRIYLSRETHMMVVDEVSGKVIADLPDTKGIHGMALAYDLGKGFTSNGQANSVTVFDLKSLKALSVISIPADTPDSIIYDPATKQVITFNAKSHDATFLDATTGKVVGSVALGARPEEPALDGRGSVFVNILVKNEIAEIDVKTLAIKNRWPIAPCEGPTGLAMDTKNRRLFVACKQLMVVVNADTGKVVASTAMGCDPDGNGYDPATGFLFASCREGLISVFHQDSADEYTPAGNVTTKAGARTMVLNPKTHHVFTVTGDLAPAPPPTPDNPRPRGQTIPGTFVILELAQQ